MNTIIGSNHKFIKYTNRSRQDLGAESPNWRDQRSHSIGNDDSMANESWSQFLENGKLDYVGRCHLVLWIHCYCTMYTGWSEYEADKARMVGTGEGNINLCNQNQLLTICSKFSGMIEVVEPTGHGCGKSYQ